MQPHKKPIETPARNVNIKKFKFSLNLLNVCSLRNKQLQLENLIDERKTVHNLPNFICITEHWLKGHELDAIKINNYEIVANSHRNASNGGGTLILSSNLNVGNIKERLDFKINNEDKNFECCAIEVVCKRGPMVIVCIYRSPSGNIDDFFIKLDFYLEKLSKENKNCILAGDFNIDLLNHNVNSESFLNIVKFFGGKLVACNANHSSIRYSY